MQKQTNKTFWIGDCLRRYLPTVYILVASQVIFPTVQWILFSALFVQMKIK